VVLGGYADDKAGLWSSTELRETVSDGSSNCGKKVVFVTALGRACRAHTSATVR